MPEQGHECDDQEQEEEAAEKLVLAAESQSSIDRYADTRSRKELFVFRFDNRGPRPGRDGSE